MIKHITQVPENHRRLPKEINPIVPTGSLLNIVPNVVFMVYILRTEHEFIRNIVILLSFSNFLRKNFQGFQSNYSFKISNFTGKYDAHYIFMNITL